MGDMGQQEQCDPRIVPEQLGVMIDHVLVRRGFRDRGGDHVHPAAVLEPLHGVLHGVVVEIGVGHGVTGLELVVATDQGL